MREEENTKTVKEIREHCIKDEKKMKGFYKFIKKGITDKMKALQSN